MCRASHEPNARRCDGTCTPRTRSARDRPRYAYKRAKARTLTEAVETAAPPLTTTAGAPTTPEETRALADQVAAVYQGGDTSDLDAAYGSRLGAVRAVGAVVLARSEEIAGITGDEVRESYEARLADALATGGGMTAARSGLINGEDPETKADLARLADGYRGALAEIRPMGGDLDTKMPEHYDHDVVTAVQVAAQDYPSDWLAASNAASELHLAKSGRGFYRSNEEYTPWIERPRGPAPYLLPAGSDPEEEFLHEPPLYVATRAPHLDNAGYGEDGWLVQENEFNRSPERPPGDGWERYEDDRQSGWVRPKIEALAAGPAQTVGMLSLAALPVRPDSDVSPYASVATHELAHRMEATVPGIGDMEADWLEDRTTLPDGSREAPAPLGGTFGAHETAYRDHFLNAYMGRDYDQERTPGGHEVLSMGWESMLHGKTGGLVGASRGYPDGDDDMRLLVLGVLATAALPVVGAVAGAVAALNVF